MRLEITGVPETITVEGKTFVVRHGDTGFWANVGGDETRTANTLMGLRTSVKSWMDNHKADLEWKREEARQRREELAEMPTIYAMHGSEKITVRGWSGRTKRYGDRELLVTMADGTKKSLPPRVLRPVGFDPTRIEALEAEKKAVTEELGELGRKSDVHTVFNRLRSETLVLKYDPASDSFTGTYGLFTVHKPSAREVRTRIETLIVAQEFPWTVSNDGTGTKVLPTRDLDQVTSYMDAWATREEAERFVVLSQRSSELWTEIRKAEPGFDYDAEVAKIREREEATA